MARRALLRAWRALASLELTILSMALLMALTVLCTLAQVKLGTYGAVQTYMRSWWVWWRPEGALFPLPTFPGGALVGLVLTVNLTAALIRRFDRNWRKAGLWVVHAGLILLVAGEFCTGIAQREMSMAIEEGQTVRHLESYRDLELVVTDTTDPGQDVEYGVPWRSLSKGASVPLAGTPVVLKVHGTLPNAELLPRTPQDPAGPATRGVGLSVRPVGRPPVSVDTEVNQAVVYVEPVAAGEGKGVWLVSNGLGAPQSFQAQGRTYALSMRRERVTLPYSLTLLKFRHDVYPGTDIPKNFSSLVRLDNPARGESREVLIFMNQPLRYMGRTFYQASYGKGDTLSILQVVQNPGWQIPYISCTLITLGLLVHFGLALWRSFAAAGPVPVPTSGEVAP